MITMPRASLDDIESRNMRNKQKALEKSQDDKLRNLEKAQRDAKEKKYLDGEEEKSQYKKKQQVEIKDATTGEILMKETRVMEPAKRMDFICDFNEDDVPPLE